ncbi:MAG: hypothetical protein M1816_002355 [Peltula sp. TS41687]|nr:MAG: hypothetical protein M1816_002355 [Peltula sp. TS41687]
MRSSKPRLYLALYARLKHPDSYHYTLHVSPKGERIDLQAQETVKHHCKNIIQSVNGVAVVPWIYESIPINPNNDSRLLVRVLIGKIFKPAVVEQSLKRVPVKPNDSTFNCVERVRLALAQLERGGVLGKGHGLLDWVKIQETALKYVADKKRQGRFELKRSSSLLGRAGTTWTASSSAACLQSVTEPQGNYEWPGYLELGKDFTIQVQRDFKTFVESNVDPALRDQIIRQLSLSDKPDFSGFPDNVDPALRAEFYWNSAAKLPKDITGCEGQIFELISPKDYFLQYMCLLYSSRSFLQDFANEEAQCAYLFTRIRSYCDASLVKRNAKDAVGDGARPQLGSIARGVAVVVDSDTLDYEAVAQGLVDKKPEWVLTMGGPRPCDSPVYALSYRKITVRSWKVPSSQRFVPANNRWKMIREKGFVPGGG